MVMGIGLSSFVFEFLKRETDTALLGTATFFTVPESLDAGPSKFVFYGLGLMFASGLGLGIFEHCRTHLRARRAERDEIIRNAALATYGSDATYM